MADGENKALGRPKAQLELWDGWVEQITELYKQGASDVEIKSLIYFNRGSFSNDLWERWMEEEPIFSETIKNGKLLSNAWWEIQGRTNLKDPKFSYVGWYMNMKNRFNWADKNETRLTDIDGKDREITGMVIT